MKVGTDGVILGAWSNIKPEGKVLDIGTGTGLVALMIAQRFPLVSIDAIEIDKDAAEQAKVNIKNSPWTNRITVYPKFFQDFYVETSTIYESIVINPPFFRYSHKSADLSRNLARHAISLSLEELIQGIQKVLHPNGVFIVILPTIHVELFENLAKTIKLACLRKLYIKSTPDKLPQRIILEFSYTKSDSSTEELVIESGGRHVYSQKYMELTKDFYLHM